MRNNRKPRGASSVGARYYMHILPFIFEALSFTAKISVKTEWWGTGVVICLERGADLHVAQLMPHCLLLQ